MKSLHSKAATNIKIFRPTASLALPKIERFLYTSLSVEFTCRLNQFCHLSACIVTYHERLMSAFEVIVTDSFYQLASSASRRDQLNCRRALIGCQRSGNEEI